MLVPIPCKTPIECQFEQSLLISVACKKQKREKRAFGRDKGGGVVLGGGGGEEDVRGHTWYEQMPTHYCCCYCYFYLEDLLLSFCFVSRPICKQIVFDVTSFRLLFLCFIFF